MNVHTALPLKVWFGETFLNPESASEGYFLISPSEGDADRTLHGFGSQDKDSVQSGYFSTILSPTGGSDPRGTSLTPSHPDDKYFTKRNQWIYRKL